MSPLLRIERNSAKSSCARLWIDLFPWKFDAYNSDMGDAALAQFDFWIWVEGLSGFWGFLALLLSVSILIAGGLAFFTTGARLERGLRDPKSWPLIIEAYRDTKRAAYWARIGGILDWAQDFYKGPPISWQAFGRCLSLAFAYPLIALLLGWVIADAGQVGGLELLASHPHWWDRIWRMGVIIVSWIPLMLLFRYGDRFTDFWFAKSDRWLDHIPNRAGFLTKAARLGIRAVPFVAVALAGDPDGTIYVLFFALFPFLNALADFGSVGATRFFLGRSHDRKYGIWRILGMLTVDLCVAGLFLVGLLFGLTSLLDLWEHTWPETLHFDWRAYAAAIRQEPGKGTALYAMVATTLLPTFVHVIAGLGAALTQRSQAISFIADKVEQHMTETPDEPLPEFEIPGLVARARRASAAGYVWATLAVGVITAAMGLACWQVWLVMAQ